MEQVAALAELLRLLPCDLDDDTITRQEHAIVLTGLENILESAQ